MSVNETPVENPVRLDVWSDIACPWCFIGSRKLEEALEVERAAGRQVVARHRPFQLMPEMPIDGLPAQAYLAEKFGGPERLAELFDRVEMAGRDAGIAINQRAMPKVANTRFAHSVVLAFDGDASQREVLLALFSAYFESALDITDQSVVLDVAARAAGESVDDVKSRISAQPDGALDDDLALGRELGVSSVPTFVADVGLPDEALGISSAAVALQGAQAAEALGQLFAEARLRAQS